MPAKAETPATGAAVSRLLALLAQRPHQRTLVALAGLPGSGKSTAAAQWTLAVNAQSGPGTMVALGMDEAHSLVVFLAANVMTGVVNMSMATIHASAAVALAVLCGYASAVTFAAWAAEYFLAPAQSAKLRG